MVLGVLAKAVNDRKVATEINDIWRMANEGRGRLLLVEKDFHYPARLDETGQHLTPTENITAPDVIDDAVDENIATVLSMQGRVMFMDNGQLEDHQHMVLTLRYYLLSKFITPQVLRRISQNPWELILILSADGRHSLLNLWDFA